MQKNLTVLIVVFVLTIGMVTSSFGSNLYVVNNGTDSPSCGKDGQPCRSITQAVTNAATGDTVWVGPGMYGDVNNDGDLDDPSDERQTESSCMLCIFKSVKVYSLEGAALTTISVGDNPPFSIRNTIELRSDGITFGAINHGFTIQGGNQSSKPNGMVVSGGRNVRVVDNRFVSLGSALSVGACNGRIHVLRNIANNVFIGLFLYEVVSIDGVDCIENGPLIVRDNIVMNASHIGISIYRLPTSIFTRNVSSRNNYGLSVMGKATITDSAFINNRGEGVRIIDGPVTLLRNTIVGNEGPGVLVVGEPFNSTLHENNIFGNGTHPGFGGESLDAGNCGVFNQHTANIRAQNNYWGAPSGPGVDPADKAGPGSGCDQTTGITRVMPFATERFIIRP